MKASKKWFLVASLMGCAVLVAGCGDDITEVTKTEIKAVASIKDAKCTKDGDFAFAKDDNTTYVCDDGKWVGAVGESGVSCKMTALKNADGYKIVCNGDSLGVVFNGSNGESGKNGTDAKSAKSGESGEDGDEGVPCSVKKLTADSLQVLCGESLVSVPRNFVYAGSETRLQGSFYGYIGWNEYAFMFKEGNVLVLDALDEETLQTTGHRYLVNERQMVTLASDSNGKIQEYDGADIEDFGGNTYMIGSVYNIDFEKNGNHIAEASLRFSDYAAAIGLRAFDGARSRTFKAFVDLDDTAKFEVSAVSNYTYNRVKALVKSGKTVKEAKKQASKEFYKFWGIDENSKGMDSLYEGKIDEADILNVLLAYSMFVEFVVMDCFLDSADFASCAEDENFNDAKLAMLKSLSRGEELKSDKKALSVIAKIIEKNYELERCDAKAVGSQKKVGNGVWNCQAENDWEYQEESPS